MSTPDRPNALQRANAALIRYPRFKELHEEIQMCQRISKIADEPQCMSLEGVTGAGKSTLVKTYANSIPRVETEKGTQITILYMEVPSPAGIKDVASAMLKRLGDPAFEKGTRAILTQRAIGLIKDCGVELVILDDFHHLIDSETNHILAQVSDWLKVLIKETNVPFLVVGIEGKVELILQANPQLSRLFAARETLKPFEWDTNRPDTLRDFARFVEYAEKAVEKFLTIQLPRTELLYRIHYATDGVVGNLMNLMRYAAMIAEAKKTDTLDLRMLSLAFQKRLAKHLRGKANPFDTPTEQFIAPPPIVPSAAPVKPARKRKPSITETLTTR